MIRAYKGGIIIVKVKEDLTGRVFGRLTVIEQVEDHISISGRHHPNWKCQCACGNIINIIGSHLKNGHTSSCGCKHSEIVSEYMSQKMKKYNTYDLSGEYGIGYTEEGDSFYFDLEDYDKIKNYYWGHKSNDMHFYSHINNEYILLHRFIMDLDNSSDLVVDHINTHHPEDNRKANLRIVTHSENSMNHKLSKRNTSGVTGVGWIRKIDLWRARITINGQEINLGLYKNKDDAIKARKEAEEKYFGEHSYDNSIKQWKENCDDIS